jgi:hypothetical protein
VARLARARVVAFSLPGLGVLVCLVATIVSPWSITIPPAHVVETFGFQAAVCWMVVIALVAAVLLTDGRIALAVLLAGVALIAGWFGWTMWVVTTGRFAQVPYPFVGLDLLGPGWYAAAVAVPLAAVDVVLKLRSQNREAGADAWLLASIPGFGLARLGRWSRGLAWLFLVATALYLASLQSPDPTEWQDLGQFNVPTPPPTRAPVWILLAIAAGFAILSALDTIREWRRIRPEPSPPGSR